MAVRVRVAPDADPGLAGAIDVMDRELVALALAERVTGVTVRAPGVPVDVCRWHRDLADEVLAVVISRIDEIERTEYREGLRCRDFKEALDAVRDAIGETP